MQLGVVFPGQGSQYAGMADPWIDHPDGLATLERASKVLGQDVVDLCRDEDALATTEFVQPALFACDLAAYRVLEAEGVQASASAGHSLGEFAALVAAGALELESALEAVIERGRAMQSAADVRSGTMTALLAVSSEEAAEICAVAGRGDVLAVANENAPTQVVLSGSQEAIERAEELVRSRGSKAIRLRVAGAFHSPLMQPAVPAIRDAVSHLHFETPHFPVAPNVSGRLTMEPSAMRDALSRHVVSPVRWERTIRSLAQAGFDTIVEAGPGDVLSKLARRTVEGMSTVAVGSPADAVAFAERMREEVAT